eukprot:TRINITY_DN670_c0_g1_i1.p1 TRINITY_DN670_c0_g1~~TRINITY_DN670_c0_g1_i1.p1  ORF type:complete len:599 (-),score=239.10 TRINITY_DN670_c0_g1_i1:2801-4597(-)
MFGPTSYSSSSPKKQSMRYVNGYPIMDSTTQYDFTDDDDDLELKVDPSLTYGKHNNREISLQDLKPPAKEVSLKPNQLAPSLAESIAKTTGKKLVHNVLSFSASFTEQVYESSEEDERVRTVSILYYIEDDTIMIYEKRIENSGIPQGVQLKRQPVKKFGTNNEYVTLKDFQVGEDITIYGVNYHIFDADKFTRTYCAEQGIDLNEAEDTPEDAYSSKRAIVEHSKRVSYAKPGRDQLKKFLANDRKVLRFFCVWDDSSSLFGEKRKFSLHYFLVDDTVEVKEIYDPNSGRDPFPQFMKRQTLVKKLQNLSDLGSTEIYVDSDFKVGETINVMGREFLIYDCDEYTKQHMANEYGITDIQAIPIDDDEEEAAGQGNSQEQAFDSSEVFLGSVANLDDKAPKKNFATTMKNDGKILRFGAKMISNKPVDQERRFVISFYLVDDSVGIFESPQRNSGISGGNFLKKMSLKNVATGAYFQPQDFYIGAVVHMNAYTFEIDEADEYALNYMELNADMFPQSDIETIIDTIRQTLEEAGGDVQGFFASLDQDGSGKITMEELVGPMQEYFGLSPQQTATLVRRYDYDNDKTLNYQELVTMLHY